MSVSDSGYNTQLNSKYQKDDITCQHIDYVAMCCEVISPF